MNRFIVTDVVRHLPKGVLQSDFLSRLYIEDLLHGWKSAEAIWKPIYKERTEELQYEVFAQSQYSR